LDLPRQAVDVDFLMRKYTYLPRDVLEKVASVKPRVLIGQDYQTLMVARDNVGERYEVVLPYQNDVDLFPESRFSALHRLKCTERKLEKTGLVQKYDDKIAEYVDKGYA
jgi:hypothetical protein